MGKRRRFKKIKAVDPLSTKNIGKNGQEQEFHATKQRMPRKLLEMMEMKEFYANGNERSIKRKMRQKRKEIFLEEDKEQEIRSQEAKRRPGESNYRYLRRLSTEVDISMQRAKGAAQELPEKKLDSSQLSGKKLKVKKRLQNLKEKRRQKVNDKKREEEEKERWTDHVEFGEVVMRPPTLNTKPRKADSLKKPGQRDLLLKKCFSNGKKSKLSLARTKILDDERQRVIQAYRDLKNKTT